MERWNRTTITWPMWGTNIYERDKAVTSLQIPNMQGIYAYHVCTRIKAESCQGRAIELTLAFNDCDYELTNEDRLMVRARILERYPFQPIIAFGAPFCNTISINLELRSGEHFCERAIEFVKVLFRVFEIRDNLHRICGNFEIIQETFVREENGELRPYADWLRRKFELSKPYVYGWTN